MTTESSPPLVGFNNNVRYRGMRFHIQTEDSGVRRPHIITHLFADGGHVIKSLRTDYAEFVDRPDRPAMIHKMMRDQHRAMALDLRDGRLDATIDGLTRGAPPPDSSPHAAESPPRVLPPPERPAGCVTHVPMTVAEELSEAPRAPVAAASAMAAAKAAPVSEPPPTSRSTPSSKRAAPSMAPATSRSVSPSARPPSSRGTASSRRPPAAPARPPSSRGAAPPKHTPTLAPPPSSRNAGKGERTRRSGELEGSRSTAPKSSPITEQSREAPSSRSAASSRRAAEPAPDASGGRKRSRSSAAPGTKRSPASSRKGGRPAPATALPAKPNGESIFGALPQESIDDVILSYVSSTKGPPSRRPK